MAVPDIYFPFGSDEYQIKMDVRPVTGALIQVDRASYPADLRLKHQILESDFPYYCYAPAATGPAAREVIELLLPEMARCYPEYFALSDADGDWRWSNRLLGTEDVLSHSLSSPLDWIGRQVQEDLVLMTPGPRGVLVLSAGHLCFASKWCLGEKIGQDMLEMHRPVPGFAAAAMSSELLMARLKPGRPVERLNWTVNSTDRLNLAPALRSEWEPSADGITVENAGERCFLRVERQTFSRLPRTGAILFTMRHYLYPVATIIGDAARLRRFAGVMRGLSAETLAYKGMASFSDALISYLAVQEGRLRE